MYSMQSRSPLEYCVDFILNTCSAKDLDLIIAAVERKKKRLSGEISFDPEAASKRISEQIMTSIQKGMDGMSESLKSFSADLIAKEAPELSKEQAASLIENWIPDMSFDGSVKSIAKSGKVNGIPSELLYEMVLQFVSFGIGEMSKESEAALKNEMGDWQAKYWKKFPKKIKESIKVFFDGKTTYGEFIKTLKSLLAI